MKRPCRRALGAVSIFLGLAAATPADAQVSVTANGPYYATPSWSQKLSRNRFVVLADWNHEAVLDRETGLVWHRSPINLPGHIWSESHFACQSVRIGGRVGWRLPAMHELASLSAPRPNSSNFYELPDGHPFDFDDDPSALSATYWSATRDAGLPGQRALLINFDFGFMSVASMSSAHRLWCVRGAGGDVSGP